MLVTLAIPDLVRLSTGLVRIRVVSANARVAVGVPLHDRGVPLRFTDHLVEVTEILKAPGGLIPGSNFIVRTVRASSEARFFSREDAYVFLSSSGIEEFLFVRSKRAREVPWGDAPLYRVYGGFQGKWTVETGAGGDSVSRPDLPLTPGDVFLRDVRRELAKIYAETPREILVSFHTQVNKGVEAGAVDLPMDYLKESE